MIPPADATPSLDRACAMLRKRMPTRPEHAITRKQIGKLSRLWLDIEAHGWCCGISGLEQAGKPKRYWLHGIGRDWIRPPDCPACGGTGTASIASPGIAMQVTDTPPPNIT